MRCIFLPVLDIEEIEEIKEKSGSVFLILYMIILAKNNAD
jgi:hypothetical protein